MNTQKKQNTVFICEECGEETLTSQKHTFPVGRHGTMDCCKQCAGYEYRDNPDFYGSLDSDGHYLRYHD